MMETRSLFVFCKRRWFSILVVSIGVIVLSQSVFSFVTDDFQSSSSQSIVLKVDYRPIRGEWKPLRLRRGGFVYHCNECHRLFQSPLEQRKLVAEHVDLRLDHGRNDYCLNCHHAANRDAYITHDGKEIPSDRPAELCAKCHGLVYRDWKAGAHGRMSGVLGSDAGKTNPNPVYSMP